MARAPSNFICPTGLSLGTTEVSPFTGMVPDPSGAAIAEAVNAVASSVSEDDLILRDAILVLGTIIKHPLYTLYTSSLPYIHLYTPVIHVYTPYIHHIYL